MSRERNVDTSPLPRCPFAFSGAPEALYGHAATTRKEEKCEWKEGKRPFYEPPFSLSFSLRERNWHGGHRVGETKRPLPSLPLLSPSSGQQPRLLLARLSLPLTRVHTLTRRRRRRRRLLIARCFSLRVLMRRRRPTFSLSFSLHLALSHRDAKVNGRRRLRRRCSLCRRRCCRRRHRR
jgi:hypothetical protein